MEHYKHSLMRHCQLRNFFLHNFFKGLEYLFESWLLYWLLILSNWDISRLMSLHKINLYQNKCQCVPFLEDFPDKWLLSRRSEVFDLRYTEKLCKFLEWNRGIYFLIHWINFIGNYNFHNYLWLIASLFSICISQCWKMSYL